MIRRIIQQFFNYPVFTSEEVSFLQDIVEEKDIKISSKNFDKKEEKLLKDEIETLDSIKRKLDDSKSSSRFSFR